MLMYGRNYTVYTHSYLCYGANEALRQLKAYLVKVSENFMKLHLHIGRRIKG